jgi:methyl-accepting chemotaxis protein
VLALNNARTAEYRGLSATRSELERSYAVMRFLILAVPLVLAIVAIATAVWMIRSVSIPLHDAAGFAARVAEGDLLSEIDSTRGDEIGRLLRELGQMSRKLQTLVRGVRQRSDSVLNAAQVLAQSSIQLSERAEAQASTLEETSASAEELSSTVKQNTEHASRAEQVAAQAVRVSDSGSQAVERLRSTVTDIANSAHKVTEITGLIDSIAFQTNILSLNAAVEAARAGEHGRGFAVVAQEVRTLARRSSEVAKSIHGLIGGSVQSTRRGTELAASAAQAMQETSKSIHNVSTLMADIRNASMEQLSGIEQVNRAVVHLEGVTQKNATLSASNAGLVTALEEQASELAELVGQFKIHAISHAHAEKTSPDSSSAASPTRSTTPTRRSLARGAAPHATRIPPRQESEDWTEF